MMAVHTATSISDKWAIGIGNGYAAIATIAGDLPLWAMLLTPIATTLWILTKIYCMIIKTHHEVKPKKKEKDNEDN